MRKQSGRPALPLAAMVACLAVGIVIGWWLRATGGPRPSTIPAVARSVARNGRLEGPVGPARGPNERESPATRDSSSPANRAAAGEPVISAPPPGAETGGPIDMLRRRRLRVPIDDVNPAAWKSGFLEHRTGDGGHIHEAVDILSPRNTPVRAVDEGTIARLFDSHAGGHTIYQFDSAERFCYYYAHLERYADGMHDGKHVSAGDVIGYVGTSGNAPSGTPHLHFAVLELGPDRRWWQGRALDPYLIFRP